MSANPHRGEVSLKLMTRGSNGTTAEREVTLRPTFAALVAIERETGMGLLALARKLAQGSLEHVPAIVREAARAGGADIERAEIEEHIVNAGVMSLLEPVLGFLARMISGAAEEKSEPSQATEMAMS